MNVGAGVSTGAAVLRADDLDRDGTVLHLRDVRGDGNGFVFGEDDAFEDGEFVEAVENHAGVSVEGGVGHPFDHQGGGDDGFLVDDVALEEGEFFYADLGGEGGFALGGDGGTRGWGEGEAFGFFATLDVGEAGAGGYDDDVEENG